MEDAEGPDRTYSSQTDHYNHNDRQGIVKPTYVGWSFDSGLAGDNAAAGIFGIYPRPNELLGGPQNIQGSPNYHWTTHRGTNPVWITFTGCHHDGSWLEPSACGVFMLQFCGMHDVGGVSSLHHHWSGDWCAGESHVQVCGTNYTGGIAGVFADTRNAVWSANELSSQHKEPTLLKPLSIPILRCCTKIPLLLRQR